MARFVNWNLLKNKLNCLYNPVKLVCDGYEVTFVLEPIDQFETRIMTYINDVYKDEWAINECEERRRFLCEYKKFLYSFGERIKYESMSPSILEQMGIVPDAMYSWFSPAWESFDQLKKHLKEHNKHIKIVHTENEELVTGDYCNSNELVLVPITQENQNAPWKSDE